MERKLDQGDKKDHRPPNRSPSSSQPSVLSPGLPSIATIRTPPIPQPLSPATIITSPPASTDHHPQGHYGRSYTCVFCKKGFSNAQALGGHMNIHRRDRAKLRESTSSAEDASSMLDDEITGGGVADEEPVLPLFVDKPTTTSVSQRDETESREQVRGDEGKPSVDLELRLSSSSLPPPSSSSPSGGK